MELPTIAKFKSYLSYSSLSYQPRTNYDIVQPDSIYNTESVCCRLIAATFIPAEKMANKGQNIRGLLGI